MNGHARLLSGRQRVGQALCERDRQAVTRLPALTFVSAHDGLLGAAIAEGLAVENPNRH